MSVNYAQALPGTPLYEYAREHGYLGKSMEQEEQYLLDISDKDAYDNDHFINYTKQPLLKVFTWRHRINWEMFREHAKINLKIDLSKTKILLFGLVKQDILCAAYALKQKRSINIFTGRGVRFAKQIIYKKTGKVSSYR